MVTREQRDEPTSEPTRDDRAGDVGVARSDELTARLDAIVRPVVEAAGFELDDLGVGVAGRQTRVQVFIDKDGGVTVEDCADVSQQLDVVLDSHDPIPHAWRLEVSSPGLTRPLRRRRHWDRAIGRPVVAVPHGTWEGRSKILGRLSSLEGDEAVIEEHGTGESLRLPLERVAKARLELESVLDEPPRGKRRRQAKRPSATATRHGAERSTDEQQ